MAATTSRAAIALIATLAVTPQLRAQAGAAPPTQHRDVDALIHQALAVNPRIRAAQAGVDAARARIAPAGTRPDPMLGIGIANLPVSNPGFSDFMTMKMLSISQTLPYPGKLPLARTAAERELEAAQARERAARLDVVADLRSAYYDLAFYDRAFEVLNNTQKVLVSFVEVTESRYAIGAGGQQDILKARVETARIAEEAVAISEQRRAALARLNAVLDRPSGTPVNSAEVPQRIARAAVADDARRIRFASVALGARAADSPLPSLQHLQDQAVASNPTLRAHEAEIAAQTAREELAAKTHLPDLDLSLQYGQRDDRSDMLTFMVSVPVPLNRAKRQDQQIAEAGADLAGLQAEHHAMVNTIRAEVATTYSAAERARARLALFVTAIIPQGRGALESTRSAFQVGRADFQAVLADQNTVFNYELEYFRTLSDFAKQIAELERVTGAEVLP